MAARHITPMTLRFTQFPASSSGSIVIDEDCDASWTLNGPGGGRSSGLTLSADESIGLYNFIVNEKRIELDTRSPAGNANTTGGKAINFQLSLFVKSTKDLLRLNIELDGNCQVAIKANHERTSPYGSGYYTIAWGT